MLKLQERNEEVLNFLNAKLVRDYSKIAKKTFKTPKEEKILNTFELGTDDNKHLINVASGAFIAPFGIGVLSAMTGFVSLIPMVDQTINSNVSNAALELEKFGEKAMLFGVDIMHKSLPLALIPTGVVAISVSAKIYQMLRENKKEKQNAKAMVINYIDDILDDTDDDTLEFSKNFFKRVDLSSNDPKENMKLIEYLAYHRIMLKWQKMGKVSEDDVNYAYESLILYLQEERDSKKDNCLKNNRFVNLLIDEYNEKKEEDIILGRIHR